MERRARSPTALRFLDHSLLASHSLRVEVVDAFLTAKQCTFEDVLRPADAASLLPEPLHAFRSIEAVYIHRETGEVEVPAGAFRESE